SSPEAESLPHDGARTRFAQSVRTHHSPPREGTRPAVIAHRAPRTAFDRQSAPVRVGCVHNTAASRVTRANCPLQGGAAPPPDQAVPPLKAARDTRLAAKERAVFHPFDPGISPA